MLLHDTFAYLHDLSFSLYWQRLSIRSTDLGAWWLCLWAWLFINKNLTTCYMTFLCWLYLVSGKDYVITFGHGQWCLKMNVVGGWETHHWMNSWSYVHISLKQSLTKPNPIPNPNPNKVLGIKWNSCTLQQNFNLFLRTPLLTSKDNSHVASQILL